LRGRLIHHVDRGVQQVSMHFSGTPDRRGQQV